VATLGCSHDAVVVTAERISKGLAIIMLRARASPEYRILKMTLAAAALLLILLAALWLWTPDRSRQALQAQYLRSASDLVEVDGQQLHLRVDGDRAAPALIFLHGMGASLHTWEDWARSLAGAYRVIRLDLPGSGLSAPDLKNDYSDARTLRLLLAVMDRLEVPRASFIGNSIGGRLAWTLAAQHPERVVKLVLVSPDGFASPGFEYGKAPELPGWLQAMRYLLPRAVLRMNLLPAYANPDKLTSALLDRYHDLMRAPGARAALLQRMQQTVLRDPVPLLHKIQAPTLLLWGEEDRMIPIANASDYLKATAGSTLVRLPGIGHLPQEEDPQASLVPVREFLAR
jgi:pimeloyl-ACP methyl ester carboxylesterase